MSEGEMKIISVRLPVWMVNKIDDLVYKGVFVSRAEVIRYGVRIVLKKYENELKKQTLTTHDILNARLKKYEDDHNE